MTTIQITYRNKTNALRIKTSRLKIMSEKVGKITNVCTNSSSVSHNPDGRRKVVSLSTATDVKLNGNVGKYQCGRRVGLWINLSHVNDDVAEWLCL